MKKLLIVDNDLDLLNAMDNLLSHEGYHVVTAEDGLYALDILKTYTPDVIFIDLVMPNIDGKKLCKIIRETPKIKDTFIVILSATAAEEDTSITELGANEYIAKGPDIVQNVLDVLKRSDIASSQDLPAQVIGLENISSRGITKELLSVKRHFEIILDRMSEGILEITPEGRIVYANPIALSLIEIREEKLLGSYFIDLFTEEDDRKLLVGLLNSIDNEPKFITYDSPVNLNGHQITLSVLPIDENRSTAIIILTDVTERKKWEISLRESKDLLNTVINSTKEAMISIGQDGLITIFNQSAEAMFAYKQEEIIGRPFDCLMPEGYKARHNKYVKTCFDGDLSHKAPGSTLEVPGLRSDGSVFPMEISFSPGMYGGNRFVIAVARDITERRAAEEEKWRLAAQLQYAQKMETVGTLAGGIAHDFNNLLMAMEGNVSYMNYHIDKKQPYYEELKNIEKQIWRGVRLTSQLLGYARKGKYIITPVDLNKLVAESAETFSRTRKEINVYQELSEDLFAIEADQEQLMQAFMNMYLNAADAMPGGGDLFLKTANVTHEYVKDQPYEPKPGNYVLLTITDTGVGMEKETMKRVFDPFFTTKEVGRGTGLGLSSVYGIVKGHGGYVFVESEKGVGSTFSICFPASEKRVQELTKDAEEAPVIKGDETILIVDDEETSLDAGVKMLQLLGYKVFEAKGGKEALNLYEENKDKIALVILDLIMPDMGGRAVYESMKEINSDLKILLTSGYLMDEEWARILEKKCDDFMQKPFSMHELSVKIRELLSRK
jgi:two-component system cell cycle sensor histidine kinase/response regulator CckA